MNDVFGVLSHLTGLVWEGAEDSQRGCIPGNGPVSVSLDNLGRFAMALLTDRLKFPMEVVILSSVRVEKSPEKMASRLTIVPDRTCFHLDLGKGGSDWADCRDQRACLRSAV